MKKWVRNGLLGVGAIAVGVAINYAVKAIKEIENIDLEETEDGDDLDYFEEDEGIAAEWDDLPTEEEKDLVTRDSATLYILSNSNSYTAEQLAEFNDIDVFKIYNSLMMKSK